MKLYLNKYNEVNKNILLDLKDFKFKEEIDSVNIDSFGFYDLLGEKKVGFTSINENLFLFIEEVCYKLDIDSKVDYKRKDDFAYFSITQKNNSCELKYSFEEPLSTLGYSESDEDSDLGLWIFNLLNSPEKIKFFKEYNNIYIDNFVAPAVP